ncbi:DUF58 domain-containing protein [Rhodoferax sp. BLA1]|uniref:DUF58 domain-containing protein n=1 Tax=Rhodoferax sp. BLA1 TaxID=2576062 RepID=UPI0015D462BE|nr:DUF58 domain-containing protein [Rhodoferax sp. BLA1]
MESWLSKSRVLLALCAVLLMAAINRHDPMVYAMFLFLVVVTVLGFGLPWLSLRGTTVHLSAKANTEVTEGEVCPLDLVLERSTPWPAFMVMVETEWIWASQRLVLSQTVPVLRAGHLPDLGGLLRFPCRGLYQLNAVRLSSGFPLGLVSARHGLQRPEITQYVLPQPQPVHWPLPWDVTDDPQGELSTRRMGQSFELGLLRPYQQGEPVGRVSWRASARVGELVIQHFQQSGSVRLRLLVQAPRAPALGEPDSAGEQSIRLAAGVGEAALNNGAQLFLYLDTQPTPLRDGLRLRRALAEALPTDTSLSQAVARLAQDTAPGEQVAVVVSGSQAAPELLAALTMLANQACRVLACIAVGRRAPAQELQQARQLAHTLTQAGFATLLELP